MIHPFGSLPENLAAFCRMLAAEYGWHVGSGELHDAARALGVAPLEDEGVVRDVLRPVLCSNLDEVREFDVAFNRFFHGESTLPAGTSPATARRLWNSDASARITRRVRARSATSPEDADGAVERSRAASTVAAIESEDELDGEDAAPVHARLSPLAGEGEAPELSPVDAAWRQAARALVRRFAAGQARTWRSAPRGPRFDLRGTLRTGLHTGGEWLHPRWRARPRRRPRFVIVIDGSRSMAEAARAAMQVAVALASATSAVEVFAFSTELERITPDVRRAATGRTRRLPQLQHAWGGGTSIGACLEQFTRRFGARLLSPDTIIFIASDGLDAGDPDVLRNAVARLHRQSAAIVWLNPLVETPGFEPTARGMQIARPYIATLAWVGDATGLARLARSLRLRR